MPKVLIIDDEPNVLYSLRTGLDAADWDVATARTAKRGIEAVAAEKPDVVLLDVRLPDLSGLEAFDRIRANDARLPVVVMTAYASTDTAIEAMKRGAFEYLLKPVDLHQLLDVLERAAELRRMQAVPAVFQQDGGEDIPTEPEGETDQIVGTSPAMQEVYKAIGRLAPQDVTVLLLGESGTGKELVARAIYQHSKRADKPFLAINCAAIPESLLESELFGHEKGAFTGADRQRIGKFEQAHGGTLFLDEVGDMTPLTQAKVLRLLQEQKFERVGGRDTIATDVRVIAATNQDLEQLVTAGKFRQDLLYRLNGFTLTLPPLRERKEDIPLLAEYFIRQANRMLGKDVRTIAPEAIQVLQAQPWPGNIRELQGVIRAAVLNSAGDVLTVESLPPRLRGAGLIEPGTGDRLDVVELVNELIRMGATDIYRQVTEAVDRVVLEAVLAHAKGNQVKASVLLGISRTTLRARLNALGLSSRAHSNDESS
jgi:two-component system nitrogen regulation response regulator GlnG